jgi:hypothetical protein
MTQAIRALADRARFLKRTLGARSAAGYLRNRGASLQEALWIVAGTCVVRGN